DRVEEPRRAAGHWLDSEFHECRYACGNEIQTALSEMPIPIGGSEPVLGSLSGILGRSAKRQDGVFGRLSAVSETPETRYAKTADGIFIAYQVMGDGDIDL